MADEQPDAPSGVSGSKVVVVILTAIALMVSAAFYLWFQARDEFKRQQQQSPASAPR